jgi:hypothetical protein
VLGVVSVPIVPVPVLPLVPVLPPVVCAAATPSARNKIDEARKYLAMESPLFNCKFAKFGLIIGMPYRLWEMGAKMRQ